MKTLGPGLSYLMIQEFTEIANLISPKDREFHKNFIELNDNIPERVNKIIVTF